MDIKNAEVEPQKNIAILDRSIVFPNSETPRKAALNSLQKNIINSLNKLIIAINLILLGHVTYNKNQYELFMTYQIGIFILEFLGKDFIIGLMKYLFEDIHEKELYNIYIRIKSSLVFLILILLYPFSILSYYIIKLLLKNNFEIYSESIIKEVFFKFLLFAPVIYLFEILFLLNIQFLHYKDKNIAVFLYSLFFIITHIVLSYILLYILEKGLIGLTISYFVNSFLFYLFTNQYIKSVIEKENQSFFFLVPNKENFDEDGLIILKNNSILSIYNLGDIFMFQFIFLSSLFTDKNQLIINIIYINFYQIAFAICRGFYYSLKNYILKNKEDLRIRQEYVTIFSIYYIMLVLSIFVILLIFKNFLLNLYLFRSGGKELQKISYKLRIIYPICILISCVRMILNAMLRGMNIPFSLKKKIFYIIIYVILGLTLCFYYYYGIFGLWISALVLNIFFILESVYKSYIYLPQLFHSDLHFVPIS